MWPRPLGWCNKSQSSLCTLMMKERVVVVGFGFDDGKMEMEVFSDENEMQESTP